MIMCQCKHSAVFSVSTCTVCTFGKSLSVIFITVQSDTCDKSKEDIIIDFIAGVASQCLVILRSYKV